MKKIYTILLKDDKKRWHVVVSESIMHVHAHDGYCSIYVADGKVFIVWKSLAETMKLLNTACKLNLVMISRGHAVYKPFIGVFSRDEGLFLQAPHDQLGAIPLSEDGYNTVCGLYISI